MKTGILFGTAALVFASAGFGRDIYRKDSSGSSAYCYVREANNNGKQESREMCYVLAKDGSLRFAELLRKEGDRTRLIAGFYLTSDESKYTVNKEGVEILFLTKNMPVWQRMEFDAKIAKKEYDNRQKK